MLGGQVVEGKPFCDAFEVSVQAKSKKQSSVSVVRFRRFVEYDPG